MCCVFLVGAAEPQQIGCQARRKHPMGDALRVSPHTFTEPHALPAASFAAVLPPVRRSSASWHACALSTALVQLGYVMSSTSSAPVQHFMHMCYQVFLPCAQEWAHAVLVLMFCPAAGHAVALSWAPCCRVLLSWPSCCQLLAVASWVSLWL